MTLFLTGANGQLGRALQAIAPADTRVVATDLPDLDITDADAVGAAIAAARPTLVINCAAHTAVDAAETEGALSAAINARAPGLIAAAARAAGARMIHVSTDFVFDGARSTPYPPEAAPSPLGVYGRTKRDGELAVLAAYPEALVVRTAWVYAAQGRNFVHTMLRLMRDRGAVSVVADQIGTPTWATTLARALLGLDAAGATGFHHATDAGAASWYDFAVAIAEEALALGLLPAMPVITPIRTQDYPTPAARPAYSVLDKTSTWALLGAPAPHWRESLRAMLSELKALS
jgi:dTDP-4-dehydrorhamnose reductase